MTPSDLPLAWVCALAIALAASSASALALGLRGEAGLRELAGAYVAQVDHQLRQLGARPYGAVLARAQLAVAAACVAGALGFATPWPLVGVAVSALAPSRLLAYARQRRGAQLEAQIDVGLVAIAGALEANGSLGAALASAAQVLVPPLSEELTRVVREMALGTPLERVLHDCAERIERPRVRAALTALRLAQHSGGNVPRTLGTCAASLRELKRLEGVVESKIAEARAQAVVVAIVPLPLFAMLHALDPELLAPVWGTRTGHVVLAIAAALWAAAVILARKIADVDV